MNNVQNCDSYINIPSSQTCRPNVFFPATHTAWLCCVQKSCFKCPLNSLHNRQQNNWKSYSFMHTLCSCHLLPCHETFQWWTAVMLVDKDIFSKCTWDGSITGGNYSSCPHNSNQAAKRSVQLATPSIWGVSLSFPDTDRKYGQSWGYRTSNNPLLPFILHCFVCPVLSVITAILHVFW
jgi:hypothetical protein